MPCVLHDLHAGSADGGRRVELGGTGARSAGARVLNASGTGFASLGADGLPPERSIAAESFAMANGLAVFLPTTPSKS